MQIFSFVSIIVIVGILQGETFVLLRFNDQRENIIKYAQHQPHSANRKRTRRKKTRKTNALLIFVIILNGNSQLNHIVIYHIFTKK